ncbi:MAG: fibronectin type III domain-containing protein [Candidatus Pacebacteria bacterium]|nr:fibronectin type III domain-containing protein [Candidatus Paceibacterota bacterium]
MKNFFQKTIKENVLTTHQDHKKDLTYFYNLRVKINRQKHQTKNLDEKNIQTKFLEKHISKNLLRLLPEKIQRGISSQKLNLTKIFTNFKNQNYNQMKNPLTKFNRKLRRGIFTLTPKFIAFAIIVSVVFSSSNADIVYAAVMDTTAPTVSKTGSNVILRSGDSSGANTVTATDAGGASTLYAKRQNYGSLKLNSPANLTDLTIDGVTVSGFSGGQYLYPSLTASGSTISVAATLAGATITVNGTSRTSGQALTGISISSTTSTVTVVVQKAGYIDTTYILRVTQVPSAPTVVGATNSGSGSNYKYVFNSSGSFQTSSAISNATILVVGGGAPGNLNSGGGGNGGSVSETTGNTIGVGTHTVTVGAAGWINSVPYPWVRNNGGTSSFGVIRSAAGGVAADGATRDNWGNAVGGSSIINGVTTAGGAIVNGTYGGRGANGFTSTIYNPSYVGITTSGGLFGRGGDGHNQTTSSTNLGAVAGFANTGNGGGGVDTAPTPYFQGGTGIVVVAFTLSATTTAVDAIPTFSNSGLGSATTTTTISAASGTNITAGACIAYTTDGTAPGASSNATNGSSATVSNHGAILIRAISYSGAKSGSSCTGTPSVETKVSYVDDFATLTTAKNAFTIQSNAVSGTAYSATVPASNAINDAVYDVVAVDAYGNQSSSVLSGWLTIDNTAPTISVVTPISTPTTDNTPNYVFTTNEAGTISYGGSCSSATTSAIVGSNTITFNTLTDGTYSNCTITVTDAVGNASSSLSVASFVVDANGPNVLSSTPTGTTPTNDNTPTWTWTAATDAVSGLAASPYVIQYATNSGFSTGLVTSSAQSGTSYTAASMADGTWYVRLKATDAAGNESTSGTFTVVVDANGPNVLSSTPTGTTPTNDNTPTWTWTAATDAVSGLAASPYVIQYATNSGFSTGLVTSSAQSGTSYTAASMADGTWYVRLKATDAAGNESTSGTFTVVVDATAPRVSNITTPLSAYGNYIIGNNVGIRVQFSEEVTSSGSIVLTMDTGGTCTISAISVATNTADCTYTVAETEESGQLNVSNISGSITDEAGNAMINFTPITNLAANGVIVVDGIKPTLSSVTLTSLGSDPLYAKVGDVVRLTFTMSEMSNFSPGPTVSFYVNGTPAYSVSNSGVATNLSASNWKSEFTASSNDGNGNVTYSVSFGDYAGNAGVAVTQNTNGVTGTVLFDKTAPTAGAVTDPAATPVYQATTEYTVTYTSGSDVGGSGMHATPYTLTTYSTSGACNSRTGGTLLGTDTASPYAATLLGGNNYIGIAYTDKAGNSSYVCSNTFVNVDNVAPEVPPSNLATTTVNGNYTNDNTPILTWDAATDSGAGLHSTTPYYIDGAQTVDFSGPTAISVTSGTNSYTPSALSDGTWYFKVRAKDAAGNYSTYSNTLNFVVDTGLPQASTVNSICSGGNSCTALGDAANPKEAYNVNSISGTSADNTNGSGLRIVEISIQDRGTDNATSGNYFGGSIFDSVSENYMTATYSNGSWSYDTSSVLFDIDHYYRVHVRSADNANNSESPAFSYVFKFTNEPPTVSIASSTTEDSNGVLSVTFTTDDSGSTQTSNAMFYRSGLTLGANITSTTSTSAITLSTTVPSYFPSAGSVLIDDEIITYTGKSGSTLTGITRGTAVNGNVGDRTTKALHTAGAVIYVYAASATGDGLSNVGSGKTISWTVSDDAPGYQYDSSVGAPSIKIVVNDGASGNMLATDTADIDLDAAAASMTSSSMLIDSSASAVESTDSTISLSLASITGIPSTETIYVQFSKDQTNWYGANSNGTLATLSSPGDGFAANTATAKSWPWIMTTRDETIYVKITDAFGNVSVGDSNTVSYNAAPEFDSSFGGGNGIIVDQISDIEAGGADVLGTVKIQYRIKDTDSDDTSITPIFQYDPAGGTNWTTVSLPSAGTSVTNSGYTTHTVYWTPTAESVSTSTATFKVTIDDGHTTNNTASATDSSVVIDSTKPASGIATFDAGVGGLSESGVVTITKPSDASALKYRIQDTNTNSTPVDTGWVSITESTTIPWTLDSDEEVKSIKYQFKDIYGNITTETTTSTLAPISADTFLIQDTSNINVSPLVNQLYVSWQQLSAPATGFDSYVLEYSYSTNGSTYSDYASVPDPLDTLSSYSTNYYIHKELTSTYYYKYRLGVKNSSGNTSMRVGESILAKPDGSPNYGEGAGSSVNASVVDNVIPTQDSDTKDVTITYKLTDSTNNNKTNPNYDARVFYNVGTVLGSSPLVNSTTIKLSSTAKLKSSGYIKINNEILKYTGISGNNLTGVTRATWADDIRATRTNGSNLLAGTPVWIMATSTSNNALTDSMSVSSSTVKTGYSGSIVWTVYGETALAGSLYTTLPIMVLVHDGQDALSAPLSSQSDYSETGTLNDFDLTVPTITFGSDASSGAENSTPATFTLSLFRAYPVNSTVSYAITGTATGSGTDYTLASGTATITAGQTATNIEAVINNDSIKEGDETIIVTISSPTNASLGANTTHTYTITDDDNAPVLAFDSDTSSGSESVSSVNIPISVDSVSGNDITVSYTVTGGTATGSGTDYTLASGTATITAGQTSTNISLAVVGDQSYEDSETIIITISSPNGATLGVNTSHTYTITNDDSAPEISFSASTSSGSEGTTSVTIPVSINFASYQNVSVDYTVTGGTATGSGTDYTLASGTATITAGQTTTNISVNVADDSIDEEDETVDITLSPSPTNATLGSTSVHTYTIVDNDTSTTVGFSSASSSGSEGTTSLNIPVEISAASGLDVTVNYAVTGTATGSGTDYTLASGTATIIAGQTSTNISVTVADDSIDEDDETIIVTLSSPNNASLNSNTVYTYTITDNDNAPTIGFTTGSGSSLENATPAAKTIPVSISSASGKSITVAYTITTDGTATLNSDFTATNTTGTLTIVPGATTASIPFTVINDATFEQDETIIVTLASESNATLSTSTYTYTITNDDAEADTTAPTFTFDADQGITTVSSNVYSVDVVKGASFSFPTYTVSDNVTATESITVTKSTDTISTANVTTTPIVVTYTVQDGATPKNTNTVTLRVNVVLAASYTVTVTAGANGAVDADNTTKALPGYSSSNGVYTIPRASATTGNNATFTITPANGYSIDLLTVDDSTLASTSSVTFSNIITNHTINVSFTATLDTTAPDITLLGESPVDVTLGDTYTDAGITAVEDNNVSCTEGDTTAAPQTGCLWSKSGTVNTSAAGEYKIIYKAINARGLISTAERIVNVDYADTYSLTLTITGSGTVKDANEDTISAGNVVVDSLSTPAYTFVPDTNLHKVKTLSVTVGGTTTPLNVDDYQAGYTFSQIKGNVSLAVGFGLINEPTPQITFDSSEVTLDLGATYPTTDWDAYIYASDGVTRTELVTNGVAVANGATFTITGNSTATGITGADVTYTVVYTGGEDGTVTGTATRLLNVTDNVAPVISNIATPVIKSDVVMVSWNTNEKANTQIYWDTTSRGVNGEVTEQLLADYAYSSALRDDGDKQATHWALMDTLTATTTYYYVVVSEDGSGNLAISPEQEVETVAAGQVIIINSGGGGSSGVALSVYEALQKELEELRKNTMAGMTTLPVISNIKVSEVTAFGATVSFDTDRLTVAGVDYGKTKDFGKTEGNFKWATNHKIKIGGLTVGTDYYYGIAVVDKYSNVAVSIGDKQVFKTKFFSENLDEINKIENVEQFQNEIESSIESILPSLVPPFVEAPVVTDITEDSAVITYKTNIKGFSLVGYATDDYYDETKENPYNGEVSDTTTKVTTHKVKLINLKSNTKYHFSAKAFSLPQIVGKSKDFTFITKASKIKVSVTNLTKNSFTVSWSTNGKTSSIVEYKNLKTGKVNKRTDDIRSTGHVVKIDNLDPGTLYQVDVSGLNEIGNTVESAGTITIKTSTDVTAPAISKVKVDSSLVVGRNDKTQTIISWKTDEPSTSVVYYEEGSGSPDKPLANKQEDLELTLNHVVILTTLKPGTVYRFQVASSDDAKNVKKLPIRTIITPRPSESIVDVIFKNFNESFNFINNVK